MKVWVLGEWKKVRIGIRMPTRIYIEHGLECEHEWKHEVFSYLSLSSSVLLVKVFTQRGPITLTYTHSHSHHFHSTHP